MKAEGRRMKALLLALCGLLTASMALAADRGVAWKVHVIDDTSRGADGVKLTDLNGDGLLDICTGWEEGGVTRVYLHPGKADCRKAWPKVTVGKTPSVEDAAFIDLNGDGIKDVVSCSEGKTRRMFVHWAPSKDKLLDASAWKQEELPGSVNKMMWMFAVPMDVDGKNGMDMVAAGKGGTSELGWWESPADATKLSDWTWHPQLKVNWVMSIITNDMDGDGDLDVAITDRKGSDRGAKWFENPGPGAALKKPWPNHMIGGADKEVLFMTIADLDKDGLDDVLTVAKTADILWFKRKDKSGKNWDTHVIPYASDMGRAKGIAVGDIDGNGENDIVISCESATPPKSGVVCLKPANKWQDTSVTDHEISGPAGIKFDRIELLDIDGDGDLDVLTCEERHEKRGLGVFWYENPRKK
jgi:hypothetical protein